MGGDEIMPCPCAPHKVVHMTTLYMLGNATLKSPASIPSSIVLSSY